MHQIVRELGRRWLCEQFLSAQRARVGLDVVRSNPLAQAPCSKDVGALAIVDASRLVRRAEVLMADTAVVDDVDVPAEELGAARELLDFGHVDLGRRGRPPRNYWLL